VRLRTGCDRVRTDRLEIPAIDSAPVRDFKSHGSRRKFPGQDGSKSEREQPVMDRKNQIGTDGCAVLQPISPVKMYGTFPRYHDLPIMS